MSQFRWALVCTALFLGCEGCPPPEEPVDAGPEEVDSGTEVDAGPIDAGFQCRIDDDCAVLNQGLRCDQPTATCVPARGCVVDTDCNESFDPNDYCYQYGIQCRCVTESNDGGFPGVCRRRKAPCEACTDSKECGVGIQFDPPGTCKALPGDTSGAKYCFQAAQGNTCGCGMDYDGAGYCKPQSNSCEQVGCSDDKHCPGGYVCNQAACLCELRCRWDFAERREVPPGCPTGKTCWVDQATLDPASAYFGTGRCRPPCTADNQCTDTVQNPFGGNKLKCGGELTGQPEDGGVGGFRCRGNGQCMDDVECPAPAANTHSSGYCDRASLSCKSDCRIGIDPVTSKAYNDCNAGYACKLNTGSGQRECVEQSCAELGGAHLACSPGEYCCGEDKDGVGGPDPCPPANELKPNKCYKAPNPPFCTSCSSNDECQNITLPGWFGSCNNGSKSPSCAPFLNLCVGLPGGGTACAPATYNDTTKDAFGVGKDARGCPRSWTATGVQPRFVEDQNSPNDLCTTNDDCNRGTDAGLCATDPGFALPDGGTRKACLCTAPGTDTQCPQDSSVGLKTVCKFGVATPTVCWSPICLPTEPGLTACTQ